MTIRIWTIELDPLTALALKSDDNKRGSMQLESSDFLEKSLENLRSECEDLVLLKLDARPSNNRELVQEISRKVRSQVAVVDLVEDARHDQEAQWIQAGAAEFLCLQDLDGPQMVRILRNAVSRQKLLSDLKSTARRDELTGLPNRVAMVEQIRRKLKPSESHGPFTLLFIDVDDFKLINDCHSHDFGDAFLLEFSQRLQTCLGPLDSMGRFGGDEFVLLLDGIDEDARVQAWFSSAQRALRDPILIDEVELYAKFSAGVTCVCGRATDASELLREADTAMYAAKTRGKCRYVWYDTRMQEDAIERLALERALWHALENNEISIHYQPQVDLESGSTIGFEALARWEHLQSIISPLKFIPMAERTGLIHDIGLWILETSCKQLKLWSEISPGLRLAVNVSPVQLERANFADNVLCILEAQDVDPQRLTIEVTESGAIKDLAHVAEMLSELMKSGIKVSVDDFGTGHSSLSLLHRLPVNEVKVDRSFIKSIEDVGDYSRLFVQTIQILADGIGLDVVAEGIETQGQEAVLRALGYRTGQGYLYSHPMPASEATEFLGNELAKTGI